jgi:hypothetical protein
MAHDSVKLALMGQAGNVPPYITPPHKFLGLKSLYRIKYSYIQK